MLSLVLDHQNAAVVTLPTGERLVCELVQVEGTQRVRLGFAGPRTFAISRQAPSKRPLPATGVVSPQTAERKSVATDNIERTRR